MKTVSVLGARPQFVKAEPAALAFARAGHGDVLVHSFPPYELDAEGLGLALRNPDPSSQVGHLLGRAATPFLTTHMLLFSGVLLPPLTLRSATALGAWTTIVLPASSLAVFQACVLAQYRFSCPVQAFVAIGAAVIVCGFPRFSLSGYTALLQRHVRTDGIPELAERKDASFVGPEQRHWMRRRWQTEASA